MFKKFAARAVAKLKEEQDSSVITHANQRLLLVIKARWFLIALLVVYGILSGSAYLFTYLSKANQINPQIYKEAIQLMIYPGLVVLLVATYNALYHISWYKMPSAWSGHIKTFIFAQLAADIPVVLLLIHYTGGINSWFWTLFLVINLELTYLLTANWQILAIGIFTGVSYSFLALLEHFKLLKVHQLPFLTPVLHNSTYLVLMLVWVNLICGFACIVSIFLHKSEHDELKDRIERDALTGLYNRRYFNHRLNSEIQRAKRYGRAVSVIMFDIDNFKQYNDTYGHVQGDTMLRWVADIFKLNIRRSDKEPIYEIDIACRFGGEEFAIILPETVTHSSSDSIRSATKLRKEAKLQTDGAVALAERVRHTIENAEFTAGKNITISAGVACYPIDGSTEKEIVEIADRALYVAKRTGKNKIIAAYKKLAAVN